MPRQREARRSRATRTQAEAPADVDRDAAAPMGRGIAARIQSIVVRELDAIENVLESIAPTNRMEADRSARALAQVARTVRELAALNNSGDLPATGAADDPVPRDIDEFRRELTRRIRGFIEERRGRASATPAPPER